MLLATIKWLLSRVWIYAFAILACVNLIAIVFLSRWLWPFLHSDNLAVQARALPKRLNFGDTYIASIL